MAFTQVPVNDRYLRPGVNNPKDQYTGWIRTKDTDTGKTTLGWVDNWHRTAPPEGEFDELLRLNGITIDADERKYLEGQSNGYTSLNWLANKKYEYSIAGTDEEREAISKEVEEWRRRNGYYMANADGTGFTKYDAPAVDDTTTSGGHSGSGHGTTSFGTKQDELIDAMMNYGSFSYNKNDDPSYQAYAKEYMREGERAMRDTLAEYSANTGGIASSAAIGAAEQANNYYGAKLADKVPELYDAAYNRWLDEFNMIGKKLDAVNYEREYQDSRADYEREYADSRSDYEKEYADSRADADREYKSASAKQALSEALTAAEMGDFSKLKALGYDTSKLEAQYEADRKQTEAEYNNTQQSAAQAQREKQLAYALEMAELGNYSYLEALGVDVSVYKQQQDIYYYATKDYSDNTALISEEEWTAAKAAGNSAVEFTYDTYEEYKAAYEEFSKGE